MWVAAAVSAVGVVAALLVPGRVRHAEAATGRPLVLAPDAR